ncbi:YihY/virulence factor BrkB family protein [Halosegnis longus]|uniref:YihY/virulence factor BrkB family protein n=1 Tax=Halosegnis longus TaxID=2216012 RepID=UPI00096A22F8|nr:MULTISPECIES: YihY/virulence factor BrkB family protein [Halobacteriales]
MRRLARDVYAVGRRADVSTLAGALAYFAFVALVPLGVLFVVAIATLVGEPTGSRVLALLAETLEPGVGSLIESNVRDARGRFEATLLGTATLAFGGVRLFQTLERGFASIYGERRGRSRSAALRDVAVVALADGLALAVLGVAGSHLVHGVSDGWVAPVGTVFLFAGLVCAVLPTFAVFPSASVGAREALPGAALSAGSWTLATVAVRWYATTGGPWQYGALGVVVLSLGWLYVGGLVVLVGAALNAVLGGHVDPDEAWHPGDY